MDSHSSRLRSSERSPGDYRQSANGLSSIEQNAEFNYYKYGSQASPESASKYREYREYNLSEKKKAQMLREKSMLDDNMKDLTYMELLAGSKNSKAYRKTV